MGNAYERKWVENYISKKEKIDFMNIPVFH